MYQCANCGGALKYSIADKDLKCDYCNAHFSPYEMEKETDGYETGFFEAKYFACPQCGGEIMTTDDTAAAFCSFCGASTILTERVSKEKKMDGIIPFSIDKERCKQIFKNRMKKAWFAPSGYVNNQEIESFRGIYMPYWLYTNGEDDFATTEGKKSHRKGDYIITDHFNITAKVDTKYDGFYYDASSSFYDNISIPLAPYDVKNSVGFTPSYLSGFYADTSDVPKQLYEIDAIDKAREVTAEKFKSIKDLKEYEIDDDKLKKSFSPNTKAVSGMFLPVWFMSYRNKDRVSYATVNGNTGKIVTDIPVSPIKYLIGSMLLTIPIYLLLNFMLLVLAPVTMALTAVIAAISTILLSYEVSKIIEKELNVGDKGIDFKRTQKINSKKRVSEDSSGLGPVAILVITGIVGYFFLLIVCAFGSHAGYLVYVTAIVAVISYLLRTTSSKNLEEKEKEYNSERPIEKFKCEYAYIVTIAANIITVFIKLVSPVNDIFYYIGAMIEIVAIIVNFVAIIINYNRLGSRYLPQFNRHGGDDLA